MNFIFDVLSQKPDYKISAITTVNSSPFSNQEFEGVKIYRLGSVSENSVKRYLSYLIYNIFSVLILFIKRPDVVVVYETLSIFPAFIYSKIFKKSKIHVHYHEYMSSQEKKDASFYMKLLFRCENNLLKKGTCSQTNLDRKTLFLKDNPFLKDEKVAVYPNLPPITWWINYGQYKKPWNGGKIKLVYVGALDTESMYLEEVLTWVNKESDQLELTFYCQQISESAIKLLRKHSNYNINIATPVSYYDLPKELVQYNFGLSLYNGLIENHIYSVPNKVYEYLSCGLKVLSDPVIQSLKDLGLPNVQMVRFQNIVNIKIEELQLNTKDMSEDLLVNQSSLIEII